MGRRGISLFGIGFGFQFAVWLRFIGRPLRFRLLRSLVWLALLLILILGRLVGRRLL